MKPHFLQKKNKNKKILSLNIIFFCLSDVVLNFTKVSIVIQLQL
jgi:hypothetical protein